MKPLIDGDIPNGYFLTTDGRVWSSYKNRYLKPYVGPNGYAYVTFKNKKRKYIHRLLAEVFIPNPNKLSQVNHMERQDLFRKECYR